METHQVTAAVEHLTTFALMGFPPPPKPAEFVLTSLSIHPEEADTGETVFITALINNIGELEGEHTVNLKINEAIEKTKEMTVFLIQPRKALRIVGKRKKQRGKKRKNRGILRTLSQTKVK